LNLKQNQNAHENVFQVELLEDGVGSSMYSSQSSSTSSAEIPSHFDGGSAKGVS